MVYILSNTACNNQDEQLLICTYNILGWYTWHSRSLIWDSLCSFNNTSYFSSPSSLQQWTCFCFLLFMDSQSIEVLSLLAWTDLLQLASAILGPKESFALNHVYHHNLLSLCRSHYVPFVTVETFESLFLHCLQLVHRLGLYLPRGILPTVFYSVLFLYCSQPVVNVLLCFYESCVVTTLYRH